eukprot:GHVU01217876.1.p1 GENE.GHVU01217876.1~~GHVU01217876.1.p1  ORF type:complete len:206 (-),score=25.25 GHVU01217876.1:253-870(-)
MKSFSIVSVLLASIAGIQATNHTTCYNYFMKKDKCVWSSNGHPCPKTTDKPCTKIRAMKMPDSHLGRRYDTTIPSKAVGGGNGICGPYDTRKVYGACLWSGSNWISGDDPLTAGWLNAGKTSNCGKQIYIQRKGDPLHPKYANVVDGCSFLTKDPAVGCFQIWMTIDLFMSFGPTQAEIDAWTIEDTFTWNFNNELGDKTKNGPV